jgi:hypothetical protein
VQSTGLTRLFELPDSGNPRHTLKTADLAQRELRRLRLVPHVRIFDANQSLRRRTAAAVSTKSTRRERAPRRHCAERGVQAQAPTRTHRLETAEWPRHHNHYDGKHHSRGNDDEHGRQIGIAPETLSGMIAVIFAGVFLLSVATYLVTFLWGQCMRREQNLKKKYGAEWALVTGSSSGIGECHRCAVPHTQLPVPSRVVYASLEYRQAWCICREPRCWRLVVGFCSRFGVVLSRRVVWCPHACPRTHACAPSLLQASPS